MLNGHEKGTQVSSAWSVLKCTSTRTFQQSPIGACQYFVAVHANMSIAMYLLSNQLKKWSEVNEIILDLYFIQSSVSILHTEAARLQQNCDVIIVLLLKSVLGVSEKCLQRPSVEWPACQKPKIEVSRQHYICM